MLGETLWLPLQNLFSLLQWSARGPGAFGLHFILFLTAGSEEEIQDVREHSV